MKSLLTASLFISLVANAQTRICSDNIIGTQFTLNLDNGTDKTKKDFVVSSCRNNKFWATELGATAEEAAAVSISAPECELVGPQKCSEGCEWYEPHHM